MVNAADLKSAAAKAACGFKPRPRHREIVTEIGAARVAQCGCLYPAGCDLRASPASYETS